MTKNYLSLTSKQIFLGIITFGLITNLMVLFDTQYFYLRAIFSFVFLTTIPGFLIMLILKIRKIGLWEYFVYIIGLSIAFLMFTGLAVNWILPWFHITDKPLSLTPLLISFNILLLIFGVTAYKRNRKISLKIELPKLNWLNKVFFTFPIVFPILSILGAITLNNNGPNYLTMIMLGGITAYVFLIVLFRDKLNEHVFPWAIFMMSMSLLLMYSLRSWHITGFDIHREFQVFQLTKENFHWSMSNLPGDAYNACLSITLLPTILESILKINDEYIFKLVFQVIFSFVPVIVYLFLKRNTNSIIAFLASFFFISQYQFMQQMPALIRQEISFLFFTSFLIALFENKLNPFIKNILLLILGFSMIVSHYSTTYVALALFVFTYFMVLIFRKTENEKFFLGTYKKLHLTSDSKLMERKYHLSLTLVLFLFISSFLWFFQLTKTSSNLINLVKNTTSNMEEIFKNEMKSEQILSVLGKSAETYAVNEVKNFRDNITKEYHTNQTWINFYSPEKYLDYTIEPKYPEVIPSSDNMVTIMNEYLIKICHIFLVLSILIGVFYLLFSELNKRKINVEYIFMSLGSIFLMGTIVIIPYISIEYNIERLFQQTLVTLSLPAVLGSLIVFKFLKKENAKYLLVAIIFILYFLSYSGVSSQLFGGVPLMNLNNFGDDYERFYYHESEFKSLGWLSKNYNQKELVYLDRFAILKAYSFPRINENSSPPYILPSIIAKNAYVYSSYTNTINKTTRANYKNNYFEYNFPIIFLDQNKNLIYNNGSSEVFK